MSGLEPLAALGLACSILQLVELGQKTIDIIKIVYQGREPDAELKQNAVVLERLAKEVKHRLNQTGRDRLEKILFQSAASCFNTATKLQEEVYVLFGNAKKGSRKSAVKVAITAYWRRSRLEKLKNNLEMEEKRMQTSFLAQIWSSTNTAHMDLQGASQKLRFFIEQYRRGCRETTDLVSSEGLKTREHVSYEALRINKGVEQVHQKVDLLVAQEDKETRERFLQSLMYPDFNQRRNQVSDAHHDSLKWIFAAHEVDGSDENGTGYSKAKWDSFSKWLSSTDGVYWISGKPGSGKTTLFKLSYAEKSRRALLLTVASTLEHQYRGTWNYYVCFGLKKSHTDWSGAELRSALLTVLDLCQNGVCLFLDGLDEINPEDGTKDSIPELLDLVFEALQRSNVKLCLASRPDPYILEMRLSKYPRLRLQDLNYRDLFAYAKEHVKYPETTAPEIYDNLVKKVEGVFMWLILATKSVNEGIMYHDTTELLRKRIERLPKDLNDLYQDMWARAGADSPEEYRQTAALYLKLLLSKRPLGPWKPNVFDLMLATTPIADGILDNLNEGSNLVGQDLMLKTWQEVERKLRIYTVGLVVLPVPKCEDDMDGLPPVHEEWCGCRYESLRPVAQSPGLQFIHRSAYDFLTDTDSGRGILTNDTSSDYTIELRVLRVWFARMALHFEEINMEVWADNLRQFREDWKSRNEWVSTDWDRLLFTCERLANANRVFAAPHLGNIRPRVPLVGGDFLVFLIRKDVDEEFVISRLKNGNLNRNQKSAILISLCNLDGHIPWPNDDRLSRMFQWRHPRPGTFRELIAAGAEVNWQAPEGSDSRVWSRTSPDCVQTPWQRYLAGVIQHLCDEDSLFWKDHAGAQEQLADIAEVLVIFISNGAQLEDMVNIVVHQGSMIELAALDAPAVQAQKTGLFASIPAFTVVTILTEVLHRRLTKSDEVRILESCVSLERACANHSSSKTCRVFGKKESYMEELELWETTDEMQTRFGSMVAEVLKRQLERTVTVIRADCAPSRPRMSDIEKTLKSIINDDSWIMKVHGPTAIIKHLQELGFMRLR